MKKETTNSLHTVAAKGDLELCKLLIEHGKDINAKDEWGLTPLLWAAQHGRTATCKLLLDHGADINVADEYGKTPLHMAAQYGYTEICKLFIEHGSDINVKDCNNRSPLYWASFCMKEETARWLHKNGGEGQYAGRIIERVNPYTFHPIVITPMIFDKA